jgi:hypothetical protein
MRRSGSSGRSVLAVDDHGATPGAEGHLHRIGERVHAAPDLVACIFAEEKLFGCHVD